MIYCRSRAVSQEELTDLLWGDEENSSNPLNALKTLFHRARTMLNQLGSNAGHELIVRRDGSYAWNREIPIWFDVETFDQLCQAEVAAQDEDRLEQYLQAIELYGGDFLNKLSSEPWVMPIAAYFHNLYIQITQESLILLENRERGEEAIDICRRALEVEPYNEELYRHLIRDLLDTGNSGRRLPSTKR